MSLQEPISSDHLKKYYLLKKKKIKIKIKTSPLAREPEKAGQAKIRTFPLSRKLEKDW